MKFKAIVILMLLAAVTAFTAISCNEPEDTPEEVHNIKLSELASYKIIYPDGELRSSLSQLAAKLQTAIREKTGIKIAISDDYYVEGYSEPIGEYEILLGPTTRDESVQVMKDLKAKDYAVRLVDKKLVIASGSTEHIERVTDELIARLETLEGDDAVFYDASTDDRRVTDDYEILDVLIDGVSISDYRIVYVTGDGYKSVATELRDIICERTGYRLEMVPDIKKNRDGKREIVVGVAKRNAPAKVASLESNEFYVGESDGSLWLCGGDEYCTYQAVHDFCARLKPSADDALSLSISERVSPLIDDGTLVTMTFNVLVSDPEPRMQAVLSMIKKHSPHSFGVQEANSKWINFLKEALKDDYLCVGVGRQKDRSGETCNIFYRKDTFKLISSGTEWLTSTPTVAGSKVNGSSLPRIYTYAILECKSNGQRFMHINTHLHHTGTDESVRVEQVKYLLKFIDSYKNKMPIILTGDLNATIDKESVSNIINSGFENSQSLALVSDNIRAELGQKTIDYVLFTKDDFRVFVYDVDNSKVGGIQPSDHDPIIVRYKLK